MSGVLGNLSPEQEQALASLKAALPQDVTAEDDHELLRFLRARKFDVEASKTMFVNRFRWYRDRRIGNLTDCDPFKIEFFRRALPFSYHGFDKEGRPFYVEKSGRVDPQFVLHYLTDEEMLNAHLWSMEISVKRFPEGIQRMGGKHVEKFATVMDLEGVSMSSRHALPIIKMFAACDSVYYPERMGWLAVVNAPGFFSTLWSIVKGFLDPVTVSKIHVFGDDYKEKLLQLVDRDQLPVEYGGTCSLQCHKRNSRATPQCCIPICSSEELWKSALVDNSKFSNEHKIKAGKTFEVEIPAVAGHEYLWWFRAQKHDIEFSAQFTPTGSETVEIVMAKKKIEHFECGFHSGYRAMVDGVIKLIWDNSSSWTTSKTIGYSYESKRFEPVSLLAAEVLEPIRARARAASNEAVAAAAAATAASSGSGGSAVIADEEKKEQ